AVAPVRTDVAGDRHVAAGAPVGICYIENLIGLLALDDRCEWHEFRAFQSCIEQVVGFPARGVCKNRARPECARAKLHAVCVDGTDLSVFQSAYRSLDRRLRKPPDVGGSGEFGVDGTGKIPSQIKIAEVAALLEPVREAVTPEQPCKRTADR